MNGDDERRSRQPTNAPAINSIHRGVVSRVESYGAFVELKTTENNRHRRPPRGLVHASQLAPYRIEKIEDAVAVDDDVWVKVLDAETSQQEDGRIRTRLSLSMKYVHQDTGEDLDADGTQAGEDQRRRADRGGRGRDGADGNFGDNIPSALEQSLNSNIGMGIAIDPLAAMRQAAAAVKRGRGSKNRYVLWNDNASTVGGGPVLFNGYALVDDEEGEVATKEEVTTASPTQPVKAPSMPSKPLGRGRGTTLPAWMTQSNPSSNNADGPVGSSTPNDNNSIKASSALHSSRRYRSRSQSSSSSVHSRHHRKERKRSKKRKEKKHRSGEKKGRDIEESDSDNDSDMSNRSNNSGHKQKHRHYSKERRRHDQDSRHYQRDGKKPKSDRHSSRDRVKSERRSQHHWKEEDSGRRHHKRKRRSRSRSVSSWSSNEDKSYKNHSRRDEHKRSESNRHRNDDNTGDDDDALFENVEEAKVLIARLERKKEARRKEY
uniref:S1 motif domain-containing protein n=1 Tax=Ditylum brightwellii TaxID=49249 RepID=A0A7S2A1M2_9STRA|mmetsp:Transcript_6350/g.9630  ORF Transcript_6350/g.9630 Transcript_6350/m.9630 type:complete len:489 (+) Transcript_6350:23-1489(+)